jgi:hypothetical protein
LRRPLKRESSHCQQPFAPAVLFGAPFSELELIELLGPLSERMPLAELPLALPAPEPVVSLVPAVGLLLGDGLADEAPAAMPLDVPQGRLFSERLTSEGDLTPGVAAPGVPELAPPPAVPPPLPAPPAATANPVPAARTAAVNNVFLMSCIVNSSLLVGPVSGQRQSWREVRHCARSFAETRQSVGARRA